MKNKLSAPVTTNPLHHERLVLIAHCWITEHKAEIAQLICALHLIKLKNRPG